MDLDWQSLLRTGGFYGMAALVLVTVLVTSYLGFTVFFYCSLLVLLTPATKGIQYISLDSETVPLARVILWCFYAIPMISLVLTINWQLFGGFFSQVKDLFNLDKMIEYLEYQFSQEMSMRKVAIMTTLVIMCCMSFRCLWSGGVRRRSVGRHRKYNRGHDRLFRFGK